MTSPNVKSPLRSAARQTAATLGLWDAISLIVGIVVGVSIFRAPGDVFRFAGGPAQGFLVWGLGGVLALCGGLCYAELAAADPRFGAEYVFLSRAYGRRIGFLFAWMQTCAVLPGSVGAVAFVFAAYAAELRPSLAGRPGLVAAGAIVGLTLLQLAGFQAGRITQNVLTALKIASLAGLLACGLLISPAIEETGKALEPGSVNLSLAMVFVLYAYGGWNDAATVTPEVRDCRRNMPRALCLALLAIAGLYLALNGTYLHALGYAGLCASKAPAADVMRLAGGGTASRVISGMVMVSALGAMHGMIFAGCRLLAAVGQDHQLFRGWNRWSDRHVPVGSLLTISGVSLLLTMLAGTPEGRKGIDMIVRACWLPPPNWQDFGGGFELLVAASAPIFWGFFLLSGLSLFVLRLREPQRALPFHVPLYPVTPLLFCATAAFMLYSSGQYAGRITLLTLPALAIGLLLPLGGRTPEADQSSASGSSSDAGSSAGG